MNQDADLRSGNSYAFDLSGGQGLYEFTWPDLNITARVEGASRGQRGGVEADIYVESQRASRPGHLRYARLNLSSQSGKDTFVRGLKKREEEIDWDEIVEQICVSITRDSQIGNPVVRLTGTTEVSELAQWFVEPIIEAEHVSIIYGPGGSGKSFIAQLVAVLVDAGLSYAGFTVAAPSPVLYLDWEASEQDLEVRTSMIRRGLGFKSEANILYKKMSRSLTDDIEEVKKLVRQHSASLLIIDSVGGASQGGQNDDKVILPMFNYLREIKGIPKLLIDHTNKQDGGLYGSIYKQNEARHLWEFRSDIRAGEQQLTFAMLHRKHNNTGKLPDMAFVIDFSTPGQVAFAKTPIAGTALESEQSIPQRVMNTYSRNGSATYSVTEMAEELTTETKKVSDAVARTVLERLVHDGSLVKNHVNGNQQYGIPAGIPAEEEKGKKEEWIL